MVATLKRSDRGRGQNQHLFEVGSKEGLKKGANLTPKNAPFNKQHQHRTAPAGHFYVWFFIICNDPLYFCSFLQFAPSIDLTDYKFNINLQVVKRTTNTCRNEILLNLLNALLLFVFVFYAFNHRPHRLSTFDALLYF